LSRGGGGEDIIEKRLCPRGCGCVPNVLARIVDKELALVKHQKEKIALELDVLRLPSTLQLKTQLGRKR